jgi:hypothetical protein
MPSSREPLIQKTVRLFFYTTEEALSKCDKFVMKCATDGFTWYTINRRLPRTCRKCGCFTGQRVFPIFALIRRGPGTTASNIVYYKGMPYQAYPILNGIKQYKEVRRELKEAGFFSRPGLIARQIDAGKVLRNG